MDAEKSKMLVIGREEGLTWEVSVNGRQFDIDVV